MMNNIYHREVKVFLNTEEAFRRYADVSITINGNFLVITQQPTRDEENNLKTVCNHVISMYDIEEIQTTTQYYPEKGLDNKEQLNG
jgi:hypothetical protein